MKKMVHISTYYYWLQGVSPIAIKYLKLLSKYDKNLIDKIFRVNNLYYTVGRNKCNLPKGITRGLAYFIGVIHGDGSLHRNKKYITISNEISPYFENVLKPLILKLFEVKPEIIILKENSTMGLIIGSKVIHSFLSRFCPIGKKKGLLKIPEEILNNNKLLKEYLSGFFDTDGALPHTEKGINNLYFSFLQSDN